MTDGLDIGSQRPARQPVFNAPWTVMALVAILVGAHAVRVLGGGSADQFALTSADLAERRLDGLLTYQFVHASWAHVLVNSAFVLAFGAPVARYLGGGARGAAVFFAFFLFCGVVAAALYAGMVDALDSAVGQGRSAWALVGASGAASGLMGAAARLIQGQGRPGSLVGRTVVGMTFGWIAVNAVLGLSGLTPGTAGAPVAWQAHIFGYFCGLLLIGAAGRLAGLEQTPPGRIRLGGDNLL
ncbi:MAG TPA: rhomboid family intramembrane serine protease [Phenylobacterium sp.]|nr:rhomboid family intramembrane serine protease [Phenylobacterium sp.]